jgi:hypothetical protein
VRILIVSSGIRALAPTALEEIVLGSPHYAKLKGNAVSVEVDSRPGRAAALLRERHFTTTIGRMTTGYTPCLSLGLL